MDIRYEINPGTPLNGELVLALFEKAGISKPNWSVERMNRSLKGSSVVACAWEGEHLIGYASAISDSAWIGYLSQLAVDPLFQKKGIGTRLVRMVSQAMGEEVTLIVHSAEQATKFYQSVGFESYSNVFRLKRKR